MSHVALDPGRLHCLPSPDPQGSSGGDVADLTADLWLRAIDRFEWYMREQGRKPATVASYRVHLRKLAHHHPSGPGSVTEASFEFWAASRGSSARSAWYSCRSFYQWAVAVDLVASSPVGTWRGRACKSPYGYVTTMPQAWRSATDEHLDRLHARGTRDGSIRLHLSYLVRFSKLNPNPWLVEPGDIARWLAMHGWKPETQRSALQALRLFYRHAKQSGRTKVSPTDLLDRPRAPRSLPRPAAEDVIGRAVRDAEVRTRLMLLLGSLAGLRAGEIAAVHLGTDVDAEGILLVHGKGGHARRVPLHPTLLAELDDERRRRARGTIASGFNPRHPLLADGWLFPNAHGQHITSGHVSVLVSKALPPGITAHKLRHRFGTQAFRSSRNIRAVQELLGHASLATTERYTRVSNDDLRTAVLATPGISDPEDSTGRW